MTRNPEIALQSDILGAAGVRNYSNIPFYWDTNHGKYGQQVFDNSESDEPLPKIKKEKDTKKHLYWKESRKDKDERIEKEKETRKERREKDTKKHLYWKESR